MRRAAAAAAAASVVGVGVGAPPAARAMTSESVWSPLWLALPVAPYSRRRTIKTRVADGVWTLDQMIGIYYVHVPIRSTILRTERGLVCYAPVAPTPECLRLVREIERSENSRVTDVVLPSVAVEHKVNAGPFARAFPDARLHATDRQYSFPLNLPDSFLGLPPDQTRPLPPSSGRGDDSMWGKDLEHEVLTVKPGIGSMYQDVAMFHKPSNTLVVCDAVYGVTSEPPPILAEEPEYVRALLFHARDAKDEVVADTPENRRKGWRRIVLLFNFFFPGSGRGDLGPGPIGEALRTPLYENGWGGWRPFDWGDDEVRDFETLSDGGSPTILPIVQIILARDPAAVRRWLDVVASWNFERVVPAHLDAPLRIGPRGFAAAFDWVAAGKNEVRFCDEDVEFLRRAEEGPLNFSVYESSYGPLRGKNGPCGLARPPPPTTRRTNQTS